MQRPSKHAAALAVGLITVVAGALRLVDLGAVRLDPFYDAAVRSMGLSWHNFFFGAYEPRASVSIDKPPVDLWLQVASVKLLGFGSVSLKLPQALAGTASAPLLYAALRRSFGALAALSAAAALAVMPIEAITARSDTMDAVMMLLLVVAFWALLRACETGSSRWLLAGAAALGVAFNVKLLESLVALPGLLAMLALARRRRARASAAEESAASVRCLGAVAFAGAAALYVAVALCWLTATLLFPAHQRPWAIGSSNGSAWNAAFVFNGSERLTGKAVEVGQANARSARVEGQGAAITPPSPTRLLARSGQLPARWLGWQALLALLLAVPAIALAWRRRAERVRLAATGGVAVWLLTGLVLFSGMSRLHPRYVEGFTPAVAAMFGIGVGALWQFRGALRLLCLAPLAFLAIPLAASIEAVERHTSDAGNVGALHPQTERALSSYLRAHQGRAHYELAASSSTSVASLIVRDVRPVLMLTTYAGRPFTTVAKLKQLIAAGEVRYAFLDSTCRAHSSPTAAGCSQAARWIRSHGADVSREAGLQHAGTLWRLPRAIA